jgi:uncharacterized protein
MHKEGAVSQEKAEQIKAVLSKLKTSGIEASAAISRDGTLLAADTAPGEEHTIFAPMYAGMLAAAEEATSELRMGVPRRVVMDVGEKKLVAVGAGPRALVVALIGTKSTYAKAVADVDRAASEVKAVLVK